MTQETRPPLPLTNLLAALRERGLEIGVDDHMRLGRLVNRWQGLDLDDFRTALAAVLAKNQEEVQVVEKTFELLYGERSISAEAPAEDAEPSWRERLASWCRRGVRWLREQWILVISCAAAVLTLWLYAYAIDRPPGETPPEPQPQASSQEKSITDRPEPPVISNPTPPLANNWQPFAVGALGVSLGVFVLVYRARFHRIASQMGRRRRRRQLDRSSGPQTYELRPQNLPNPFPDQVLDDVATELGRRFSEHQLSTTLDVNRTLEQTLRKGLAPVIVLRPPVSTLPLLVLEDTADEMRLWQRQTEALLSGLKNRGLAINRWYFDGDAKRIWKTLQGAPYPLDHLSQAGVSSPLLVISTGQGVLEGRRFQVASWVEQVRQWPCRAWLNPIPDRRNWRYELETLPEDIWPATYDGLMAIARRLTSGTVDPLTSKAAMTPPDRAVTALDVERLRWLLSLAPQRDPWVAEALRDRFCPQVPQAALGLALEMPPLEKSPGVGPPEEEARRFILRLLDESAPDPDSIAHERWQLDRAVQRLFLPEQADEALEQLTHLATGPLGNEVEAAIKPLSQERAPGPAHVGALPQAMVHGLRTRLLRPLARQTRRLGLRSAGSEERVGWRWVRPKLGEMTAAGLTLLLLLAVVPYLGDAFGREVAPVQWVYDLSVDDPDDQDSFRLIVRRRAAFATNLSLAPEAGSIFQDLEPVATFDFSGAPQAVVELPDASRGHWFYAQALQDTQALAVSSQQWVPEPLATVGTLVARFLDGDGRELEGVEYTLSPLPDTLSPLPGGEAEVGRHGEPLLLGPGPWSLTASLDGFDRLEEVVQIRRGEITSRSFVLSNTPLPDGFLELVGLPDGIADDRVLINGQPWNGDRMRLPPGNVEIRFNDLDLVSTQMVTIEPDEVIVFQVTPRWRASVTSMQPSQGFQGTTVQLVLQGEALTYTDSALLTGAGTTISGVSSPRADEVRLIFEIDRSANPGTRQLTLQHAAGFLYTLEQPFEILASEPVATPAPPIDENPPPRPKSLDEIQRELSEQGLIGDVYFDSDSTELRPDAKDRLFRNAEFMMSPEGRSMVFTLEGHTEEKRTNEYNLALGQARAQAVVDFLVSLGLPASRFKTISFGEERPFCTESNESCWQQNRRVRFVVSGR